MKVKSLALAALIGSSTILVTGCATPFDYKSGKEITQEQLQQIPKGSSQGDVVAKFGQPNRKQQVGTKEVWYYDYQKIGALFSGNVNEATAFEFDSTGKLVQSYKTNETGKSGNPLLDAAKK